MISSRRSSVHTESKALPTSKKTEAVSRSSTKLILTLSTSRAELGSKPELLTPQKASRVIFCNDPGNQDVFEELPYNVQ
jgi:hypothetical protein